MSIAGWAFKKCFLPGVSQESFIENRDPTDFLPPHRVSDYDQRIKLQMIENCRGLLIHISKTRLRQLMLAVKVAVQRSRRNSIPLCLLSNLLFLLISALCFHTHYSFPTPNILWYNSLTMRPVFPADL